MEEPMDKYKKLAGNTLIFAIGSFSSKLLVFFLTFLYTWLLPPGDYGEADLITQAANLISPIAMLAVNEAVIRFVMDKTVSRKAVFTAGLATTLGGAAILMACLPLVGLMPILSPHLPLIFAFVLSNNLRSLCAAFCRGSGYVRLYAVDGVIATITTVFFNILFLAVFKMGFTGLVAGTVAANMLSVAFYFVTARLHRFMAPRMLRRDVFRSMYRYCVPLIPTTLFWWITNVSDRYLIELYLGRELTGLYALASKIPALLTLASAIFYQAWLLSAVSEFDQPEEHGRFYSRVTQTYFSLIFLAGAGLMLITRPVMFLLSLTNAAYASAYTYVPFLILSEVFSTFVTFFGAFYAAAKKNLMVPVTIFIGAAVNIVLNIWLIPTHGPQGAAFATFVSYLLVFLVRLVDVRRFVQLKISYGAVAASLLLLGAQGYFVYRSDVVGYTAQLALVLLMLLANLRHLLPLIRSILSRARALLTRQPAD
jgi:O-antigen/teichoic acid export membrane protein